MANLGRQQLPQQRASRFYPKTFFQSSRRPTALSVRAAAAAVATTAAAVAVVLVVGSTTTAATTGVASASSAAAFTTATTTTNNNHPVKTGSPVTTATTTAPHSSWKDSFISRQRYYMSAADDGNNNNNPLASMLSGVSSTLFGGGPSSSNSVLDQTILNNDHVPTWDEVSSTLSSLQTPEERSFRQKVESGHVASPLNKIRLFDESQTPDDIKVTFYRDSASWCPYCQKVWLTLEYKQIPYRVEKINMRCYGDKPRSFLQIQPGGQIPVAEINGSVYGQSNDILMALEQQQFPKSSSSKKLLPDDPKGMARAQELFTLERQLFSAWMGWLTGGGRGRSNFERTLAYVDEVLRSNTDGPFFLGQSMSMVDVQFSSFLERMVSSLLYFKGFEMRVPKDDPRSQTLYPGINAWFDAMEALPAYQLTKSDHYTHAHDLPPQLGGCTFEAGYEPYQRAIDGEDGTSWSLPLSKHLGGYEPDWDWAGANDEPAARREAVERLSYNHDAIVKFACRGAGRRGMPPVSAPLSDPNAVPNDAVQTSVDACLRLVCNALLHYDDVIGSSGTYIQNGDDQAMQTLSELIKSTGGPEYTKGVVDSLVYLRDRIGVPRDMRLPAARQLRAHLNWCIDKLSK